MAFEGFSTDTLKFLRGLSKHNDKDWFDAHRADYDAHYMEPARQFVVALGDKLSKLEPGITADPRANKSIFRIHRDVRFSKDKRPFRDHVDLWFYQGESRASAVSGFFFRLAPKTLTIGTGVHGFDKAALPRFREAVADDAAGPALAKVVGKLQKAGYTVKGEGYKRVPRGYDPEHPRADLLKYGQLAAFHEGPHPAELGSTKLVAWCAAHCKKVLPLHRWLADNLA